MAARPAVQIYTPQTVSFEVQVKKNLQKSKRTLVVELQKPVAGR